MILQGPSRLRLFLRHSENLCQIELYDCKQVKSATLQAILVFCRALESLRGLKGDIVALSLEYAIENTWDCTKIRQLTLTVSLTPDGRDPAYLADSTLVTWTAQDHQHWRMLDMLYTQIGSLVELTFLNLMATGSNPPNEQGEVIDVPYRDACLPGLLALEDPATGQIGFLSRWYGLTRLQKLVGSFSVKTNEVVARMGEREVDWFVNHLAALTRASLLAIPFCETFVDYQSMVKRYPKVISDILRRRPGLYPIELVDDNVNDKNRDCQNM